MVAKIESATRPIKLDELMPLAIALGVSQQEFFDEPPPVDRARRKVREAEGLMRKTHADLTEAVAHVKEHRDELQKQVRLYTSRVKKLAELDADGIEEQHELIQELNDRISSLRNFDQQG